MDRLNDHDVSSVNSSSEVSSKHNIRTTTQTLSGTIQIASTDIALEPPDTGDFYESFEVPGDSGNVAVVIGDVTGHGASASAKAQVIRSEVIRRLKQGDSPLETIEAANSASQSNDDRFSTVFIAKINPDSGTLTYANAGHEPPLITNEMGETEELLATGPPLGVVPTSYNAFEEKDTVLCDGGTLLATTDGVTEARRPHSKTLDFFGRDRLISLLSKICHYSPRSVVQIIMKNVIAFTKSVLTDDVVVMAVRRVRRIKRAT